jgi:uncharacterized protein YbjT (DUF2867 family)
MILITGATGFVGSALIRHLNLLGRPIRLLLRPSPQSPRIPRGVGVEVAVSSLMDERGLMAAMHDVEVIYHLAGTERAGSHADLNGVDVEGTGTLAAVAAQAGVERFFYLSHLGANRAAAFPVMKAKGIAEGLIKRSGVPYTIFRSSAVFGPNDQFTTMIKRVLKTNPFIFFMPGDGMVNLQPLWIEDLITCLTWALEEPQTRNQTFPIGGGEYLSFRAVVELIMEATGLKRTIVNASPAFLRSMNLFAEQGLRRSPVSIYWLDYLAVDHTTALDTLPRLFGLMPARLSLTMDYLRK